MTAGAVAQVEEHIRTTSLTKRIRPNEFFYDYDGLRSGYVTDTQFFRVLWENLGIQLSEEDSRLLCQKYDTKGDRRLNYRAFCEVIAKPFNPNDLTADPSKQKIQASEFLGTTRSLQPQPAETEANIEQLLRQLNEYYKYHGINLRTCCEDFDRHHIGVIQESQFYRSFPRPPEVTEMHVEMLVQKYRDPSRPGLLNYLNLHHDLLAIGDKQAQEQATTSNNPGTVHVSDFLPNTPGASADLMYTFDKIRVAVYKNRVRTLEFFKDYDKLRSGIITDNQFVCGLSLAIGKEAQLTRPEIQSIVEFYRTEDGRVRYKEFTDMMENAFNVPDLEKKPTQTVVRPPTGALSRSLAGLSEAEEMRAQQVIGELRENAKKRRLMMYQYFKDYDRSQGYSRVITPTQFARILHFLSLNVAPEDLKLLCRKFSDPGTGDVNYPAFVQVVDKEFVNYIQSAEEGDGDRPRSGRRSSPRASATFSSAQPISLEDLMARIRHHALINRRRVIEFFQDYDPLRSGAITKSQFRRGLSDFGLSALGNHNLSDEQFDALSAHYSSPNATDKVLWTQFMDDVESVFTTSGLEKNPSAQVPPTELYLVPKPGTMDFRNASDEHHNFLNQVMERLRQRTNQRRVLLKPVFQDFDRHNNGHVTRGQFRQCLTMLELSATEPEMQALEAKFCNDVGFRYLSFLEELLPPERPKMMYVERLKEIRLANEKPKLPEPKTVGADLQAVLAKIKTKVFKERVRILEWLKDYDKLRTGRMIKPNFRRALDLCQFELRESELGILEDHYQTPGDPEYVSYLQFSDDIEAIFTTKELEKMPLLDVEPFRPVVDDDLNQLAPEMEDLLHKCMSRLAEKVRKNRMQLFPLFEDYDRVHNGTVSRSQFRRVLSELELASLVATEQEWVCIYNKYDLRVGGKEDVNYISFCDKIYELAHFEWRKP